MRGRNGTEPALQGGKPTQTGRNVAGCTRKTVRPPVRS
jgi:hypothetical protein